MLEIDGSYGEGGGQILRTALSLSCLTNSPFRMLNIRKGRKKPGLMPQHIMCIHALTLISNAKAKGDSMGSSELVFEPSAVKTGDYVFDIATAGSTSLLLQALLPPLIFADNPSSVTLKGGTHVPFSPSFHYISKVFIPVLSMLGVTLTAKINNYGFHPKGGGEITVNIEPAQNIQASCLLTRGDIRTIKGISCIANLPLSIAERQRDAAFKMISQSGLTAEINAHTVSSPGTGTFIFLKPETDTCHSGFSSLGERGKKAEYVGEAAAREFLEYYRTPACLDHHLADQIILYLAVANGESSFTTSRITDHLLTNLWVIDRFLRLKYTIAGKKGILGRVTVFGKGRPLSS
jgi:RNA 3'-terminal phosphate cyclase (ATP)